MEGFEFLVVGAGIAGLSAAIRLADTGRVLCVTKEALGEANTSYAQGGIAVAMGGETDVALHLEDTMAAGDGLVDRKAAAVLVGEGPARVGELLDWGTAFDRGQGGELERTREGAHSLSRILHAYGDATGKEIERALVAHARRLPQICLEEWTTSVDLIVANGTVVGATLLERNGNIREVRAGAVLIASGGAGQIYSDTTNPAVATGDGIAMAYRAGAAVEDMEFYQFHPTAIAIEGAPRFLLSEALRGEGAYLVNLQGERFMLKEHVQKELAPRDVVARAITREGFHSPVYLDMRHVSGIDLAQRFPGISAFLKAYGLSLAQDLLPVRPAAHYLMGGIRTDIAGRTTLPGLYAAGEAACTGVHGANRLASNSLLEGLVFGVRAAETMIAERRTLTAERRTLTAEHRTVIAEHQIATAEDERVPVPQAPAPSATDAAATESWITQLRAMMWRDAGLLRDADGLRRGQAELDGLLKAIPQGMTRRAIEARNLYLLAAVIVESALGREESRGAHFRSDFPVKAAVAKHSVMQMGRLSFEA